jgi:hypothetical protein
MTGFRRVRSVGSVGVVKTGSGVVSAKAWASALILAVPFWLCVFAGIYFCTR